MNQQSLSSENFDTLLRFNPVLLSDGKAEVIVKYSGNILSLESLFDSVEILNSSFAIITGTSDQIKTLFFNPIIEYVELPKTLTYELSSSRYSVCSTRAQESPYFLSGKNTVIGIIDSGIDVSHPDFRNDDGSSRIAYIWDQTVDGNPPSGFRSGSEYDSEDINYALTTASPSETLNFFDSIGHGTAVAGVACGNGRQSNGREKGIAPEATIVAVKLGRRGFGAFPRTTEVMRGIRYTIDKARELGFPLSINLSFGTNNGSHDGNSLFEQYINSAADEWKTCISVATGNEGAAGHHFSARVNNGESIDVPFSVSGAPQKIYMTLWKNFSDTMAFRLLSPSGNTSVELSPMQTLYSFTLSDSDVTVFYSQPTPLTQYQEVYFLFESRGLNVTEGIWILQITGSEIVDGRIDIWLPTFEDVTDDTSFVTPDPNVTLTLPSTAQRVISVGGYDANTNTDALFSGRGPTRYDVYLKPDIVAPAVNILAPRSGGGYMQFTGTSLAAPFVAGACCLMMEWGITMGNDPFLYGQRAKAFLQKGAKRTASVSYPNITRGYGALCISNTLDLLVLYNQGGIIL